MASDLIRRWWPIGLALALPTAVLIGLRLAGNLDLQWFSAQAHLLIMLGIATCALAVAGVAIAASVRADHPGVVLLAIGCAAAGILLLGHGLVTPGVMGQPFNQWVGRLPYSAIAVLALCLFLAGRSQQGPVARAIVGHPVIVMSAVLVPLVVGVTAVVLDPLIAHGAEAFAWEDDAFDVVSTAIVVLLLVVIVRHWRRWHLGHDPVQLALALASAMCIAAVLSFEHGVFARISWWDYHAYLLAGFGGAVYAVLQRSHERRTLSDVLSTTFTDDPFDHIVKGYPEALRTLVKAVEVKDAYTHGHSERTARVAIELGIRMGLAPDRLRVIARGAYLHDLGKIGIPDEILNKPGKLTPEERAVMETHPRLGYELAASATSLQEALPVILHHHERFDGDGYPDGLAARKVPLEARVVSVADVWDALTSDRAYRKGWEPEAALAHIHAGRGTHFDPVVVDAFVVLAADWGVRLDVEVGEAEVAWTAAQTCHEVDDRVPVAV